MAKYTSRISFYTSFLVCTTINDDTTPSPLMECMFPFTWNNTEHTQCTKVDFTNYWCATGYPITSAMGWGICENTCANEDIMYGQEGGESVHTFTSASSSSVTARKVFFAANTMNIMFYSIFMCQF